MSDDKGFDIENSSMLSSKTSRISDGVLPDKTARLKWFNHKLSETKLLLPLIVGATMLLLSSKYFAKSFSISERFSTVAFEKSVKLSFEQNLDAVLCFKLSFL